jgi:hypothetical protein
MRKTSQPTFQERKSGRHLLIMMTWKMSLLASVAYCFIHSSRRGKNVGKAY